MKSFYKFISITFLILLTTSFHLRTIPSDYAVHVLHRELFFLPIILSSFWFGLRSGGSHPFLEDVKSRTGNFVRTVLIISL